MWSDISSQPTDYRIRLYNFFMKRYPAYSWPTLRDCPYNLWDFSYGELVFKQYHTWLQYKRVDPESGLTCAQEFAAQIRDKELASMLVKSDTMSPQAVLVEKLTGTGTIGRFVYQNRRCNVLADLKYPMGYVFFGLLYPWGPKGTYQVNGITSAVSPERLKRNYLERMFKSVEIRPGDTTHDTLLQYDMNDIYTIHDYFHVGSKTPLQHQAVREIVHTLNKDIEAVVFTLPGHARKALRMVIEKGGSIDLGEFRRFVMEPPDRYSLIPNSSMGVLHKRGLLLAGYRKEGARKVPVLTISPEVSDTVSRLLQDMPPPHLSSTLAESLDNIINESRRLHWLTMMTAEEFDYIAYNLCESESVLDISQNAGLHPRHLLLLLLLHKVGHIPSDVMVHADTVTRLMAGNNAKILSGELIDIIESNKIEQHHIVYAIEVFDVETPGYKMMTFGRDVAGFSENIDNIMQSVGPLPKKYLENADLFLAINMGGPHLERSLLYRPITPKSAKIDTKLEPRLFMTLTTLHQNWQGIRQKNTALLKRLAHIRRAKKDD